MQTKRKPRRAKAPVIRRTAPTREIIPHELWPEGLYVAPWLNGHEGLTIIAVNHEQRLAGILEVTAGETHYNAYLYLNKSDESTELSFEDVELFSDANLVKSMGLFWAPGVHRAPWRPRTLVDGHNLIVIAPGSSYWDLVECQAGGLDALEAAAWESFDRACKEPSIPRGYDYDAHTAVPNAEYDRLWHMERQYQADRKQYGELIKAGAATDGAR